MLDFGFLDLEPLVARGDLPRELAGVGEWDSLAPERGLEMPPPETSCDAPL